MVKEYTIQKIQGIGIKTVEMKMRRRENRNSQQVRREERKAKTAGEDIYLAMNEEKMNPNKD